MKKIFFLAFIALTSCKSTKDLGSEKILINNILDNWHKDASNTNFENYFNAMAEESVFIGTDATENWNKKEFMAFAKPFFDKGKAWNILILVILSVPLLYFELFLMKSSYYLTAGISLLKFLIVEEYIEVIKPIMVRFKFIRNELKQ